MAYFFDAEVIKINHPKVLWKKLQIFYKVWKSYRKIKLRNESILEKIGALKMKIMKKIVLRDNENVGNFEKKMKMLENLKKKWKCWKFWKNENVGNFEKKWKCWKIWKKKWKCWKFWKKMKMLKILKKKMKIKIK